MNEARLRKPANVIQLDPQDKAEPVKRPRRFFSMILRALLPLAVLALGWAGYSILSVEPEKAKAPEAKRRTIKTRAVALRVQDFPTTIQTRGVIRAHNEVMLTSQVSGKVLRILPEFEDGAFFAQGDVLVEIDPQDLSGAVVVAEAQLARAKSAHAQEETRAKQARLNWNDLRFGEEPSELALRLPQLREAEANVKSATAQLEQARRNLERAKVRAPFAGRVRQRTVGLGQSVGPGTTLGSIFAIDYAEVRLPITADDMPFLNLPEGPEDTPLDVRLRDALDENSDTVWIARIVRTEGTLDRNSLALFAIARISDPFGRGSGAAPLRIGQPVVASIPGDVLENVVPLPRRAVRQLDQVVLLEPNEPNGFTIKQQGIESIWENEQYVVVRDPNITDGTLLATTHLIYAPEGSEVEILPDPNETAVDTADPNAADSEQNQIVGDP